MKLLVADIETAPITAHAWGLFKQNIGLNQIIDTGRVMCFSARWLGTKQKPIFFSEFHHDHKKMIVEAYKLLNEADAVITYNGESFDLPTLNREFLKYKFNPPAPYLSIDLLRTMRKRFRFASNKQAHIASELDLTRKIQTRGHELWIDCMNGDPKAWEEMRRYNLGDIKTLEEMYYAILPWIETHPNTALFENPDGKPTCTHCGSKDVQKRGLHRTRAHIYQRYQCTNCGSWLRGRYTLSKNRKDVLTPAL